VAEREELGSNLLRLRTAAAAQFPSKSLNQGRGAELHPAGELPGQELSEAIFDHAFVALCALGRLSLSKLLLMCVRTTFFRVGRNLCEASSGAFTPEECY
jgi:hypothetical protein